MRRKIGVLLVIAGIVGLFITTPELAATVGFDTTPPIVTAYYPSGGESSPTPMDADTTYTIGCRTSKYEWEAGATGWVNINDVKYGDLTPRQDPASSTSALWETTWNSPTAGQKIKFTFNIKDVAGNIGSLIVWGQTQTAGDPEGKFYLKDANDTEWQEATTASVHNFNNRTLNVKFVATKAPEKIVKVWGHIKRGDTKIIDQTYTEQADGVTWMPPDWTASEDGTYIITGVYESLSKAWQGMSILSGIPEAELWGRQWTMGTMASVGMIIMGSVLIAMPTKKRRR